MKNAPFSPITVAMAVALMLSGETLLADDLTMMVEKDLAALGYDTGVVDGEETMETVIAISKFQAENQLPVTGEVTPQLAGILSANVSNGTQQVAPAAPAQPAADPAALQAAQQACLQEKMAAAQDAQKKKRGFGKLLSAVTRTATNSGNYDLAQKTSDVYSASATADDLASAARDLGLTEDEIASCQNPT
ncbi:MAG: peptidoglycan-binding domain-containing protein [Woeseiaceae bacterium]